MPKKGKIEGKLEQIFGLPFNKLIDNYFKDGDSRYFIQKRLLEMIVEKGLVEKALNVFVKIEGGKKIRFTEGKWNPKEWTIDKFGAVSKESNPAFRPSSIYHAISAANNDGSLEFKFSVKNKGRKIDSPKRKTGPIIEITCKNCGKKHRNNNMEDPDKLNLRTYACPNSDCQMFGMCVAKIIHEGTIRYKAVVKVDGIRREVFVKSLEDLTPVEIDISPGSTTQNTISLEAGRETKATAKVQT